jgi:hypothetical protein
MKLGQELAIKKKGGGILQVDEDSSSFLFRSKIHFRVISHWSLSILSLFSLML